MMKFDDDDDVSLYGLSIGGGTRIRNKNNYDHRC